MPLLSTARSGKEPSPSNLTHRVHEPEHSRELEQKDQEGQKGWEGGNLLNLPDLLIFCSLKKQITEVMLARPRGRTVSETVSETPRDIWNRCDGVGRWMR